MNKGLKEKMIELFDNGWNYTQIAKKLECSKGTISYHLTSFIKERKKEKNKFIKEIENNLPEGREDFLKKYGDKLTFREKQYFFNNFYKLPNKESRKNGKVPSEYYKKKRFLIKQEMVNYKGGECEICGYKKSLRALQFHHKDPSQKDFALGGTTTMTDDIKKELDKCILVCANCHSEIHDNNLYSTLI